MSSKILSKVANYLDLVLNKLVKRIHLNYLNSLNLYIRLGFVMANHRIKQDIKSER